MTFHNLSGLGDAVVGQDCSSGECVAVYDTDPNAVASISDPTSPWSLSTTGSPLVTTPPSSSSSGINWGNIFGTLITDASQLTKQALATPGTVILPNGTVAVGTAQGQSTIGSTVGGIKTSTLMLLAGGALLLVMMTKR